MKDNYGMTPLHWASWNGHAAVVEVLVAEWANLHVAEWANLHAKDNYGMTHLHQASWNGHAAMVEALVAKGANLHAKDNEVRTPLHCGIWENK